MGGHAAYRGDAEYADAARLGHALGAHYVVATGGGPGAMEAANLGCYLADSHVSRVTDAVAALAEAPAFRPSVDAWLRPALEVCAVVTEPHDSLGDPDLALRPRAVERLRHRHREVLPQRHPRGDPPRGLRRRHRLPARSRRHRAGGLPGRLRELLRRRVLGRRDGPGRPRVLDRDPARLAAAPLAGPRPPDGGPRPPRRPRRRGRRACWLRRPARGSRSWWPRRRGSARRAPR